MQQSLLDELSGIIRLGLEERNVPLTRAGWIIEFDANSGWQLTTRLQPGIPLLAAPNQLVVFREKEEITPVLDYLPEPSGVTPPAGFTPLRDAATLRPGSAGFREELEELRERMMRQYGSFPEADKRLRELLRELAK